MCPIPLYRPLTAVPFQRESAYAEAPPGPLLCPYIRCFWFSTPGLGSTALVIPDTCADLIYRIDHTGHTLVGSFCGVSDESFASHQMVPAGHCVHLFGIRFYAWTAHLFAQDSLAGSRNRSVDPRAQFEWLDTALRQHLLELPTFSAQAAFARGLLEARLERIRTNPILQNAAGRMILSHGSLSVTQLAGEVFVSTRQLERVFQEYAGISPKKLNNLIRYQMLWQDCRDEIWLCRPGPPVPRIQTLPHHGFDLRKSPGHESCRKFTRKINSHGVKWNHLSPHRAAKFGKL